MKKLSMFSWGFSGWGNATPELVEAVDAAEPKGGFNPPIFVDVRLKRIARPKGFNEHTFEDLLGWRLYRWMPTLGNSATGTGKRKMKIASPKAARQLPEDGAGSLGPICASDLLLRVRVPLATWCHRHQVTKLLLREAHLRRIPLDVSEWPGGQPSSRPLNPRLSPESLRAIWQGRTVLLSCKRAPADFVGIPWGTIVRLKSGREELLVPVGPAAYRSGSWVLPVFLAEDAATDVQGLRCQTAKLRGAFGLA